MKLKTDDKWSHATHYQTYGRRYRSDRISYDDAYKEIKAQIDLYLDIIRSKSCFIKLHPYQTRIHQLPTLADHTNEDRVCVLHACRIHR